MAISIPADLFLRDPSNRAFLEGDSDKFQTNDDGVLWPILIGGCFVVILVPVVLGWMQDLMATGCRQLLTFPCAEAVLGGFRQTHFWILVSMAGATYTMGNGIRNRIRKTRLRDYGELALGEVVRSSEYEERDADGDKYSALIIRYCFMIDLVRRESVESIPTPALEKPWPPGWYASRCALR